MSVMQGDDVTLVVVDDPVGEAAAACRQALREVDGELGRARFAISGGSASEVVRHVREGIPELWSRVALTWADERCVPFSSLDSNRGHAHATGQLRTDHPPAIELPLFLDGESPEEAAARAEEGLVRDFGRGLDVVLLGMGADGHVASLFPSRGEPKGLVGYLEDSPKPPAARITLTREALLSARATVLFACGEAKREALARLIAGDPLLPATGLPGLLIVTDVELRS